MPPEFMSEADRAKEKVIPHDIPLIADHLAKLSLQEVEVIYPQVDKVSNKSEI